MTHISPVPIGLPPPRLDYES